jgi:hypothetical protein
MAWHLDQRLLWKGFLPVTAVNLALNAEKGLGRYAKQMQAIYARCVTYDETSFICSRRPEEVFFSLEPLSATFAASID